MELAHTVLKSQTGTFTLLRHTWYGNVLEMSKNAHLKQALEKDLACLNTTRIYEICTSQKLRTHMRYSRNDWQQNDFLTF